MKTTTIIYIFLKKLLGISLIIIGILGLFLPIIPGLLLIPLGLFLIDKRIWEYFKNWFVKK